MLIILSSDCEQGPIYLAEITPKNLRGAFMSVSQVVLALDILAFSCILSLDPSYCLLYSQ